MERRPTTPVAFGHFFAEIVGTLMVMTSVIVLMWGLLMVTGTFDGGAAATVKGSLGLIGAVFGFWFGRRLMNDHAVPRLRPPVKPPDVDGGGPGWQPPEDPLPSGPLRVRRWRSPRESGARQFTA